MSRARELAGFATATNPIQDLNVGVVTAISFSGDGSSLTGIDATSIKDGDGTVRAQANTSGVVVTGILTATSLEGDGSALTGLPAGLGTAVAASGDGANIYYTNQVLDVGSNLSVDVPATAVVAYTQYPEVAVSSGIDLTIADGDDFVADILGIGTTGAPQLLAGGGGRVRADNFVAKDGYNAPTFANGANVTGVVTASSSVQVSSGGTFGSNGASGAVYYGDGSNLTGMANTSDVSTSGLNVIGVGTFGSNISVADNIVHTGDTDTAIKFADNSITLDSAGSLALHIDGSANIGLGTNSPQKPVDVYGESAGQLRVSNSSKAADLICDSTGGLLRTIGSYPLVFNTNQTDRLRIGTSGEIGLAVASGVSTDYGTSGQVLTSGGSGAVVQWADAGGGISEIDAWTLSGSWPYMVIGSWSNSRLGDNANDTGTGILVRNSENNMPVGTGMTHTDGLFTFPSAGTWQIDCMLYLERKSSSDCNGLRVGLSGDVDGSGRQLTTTEQDINSYVTHSTINLTGIMKFTNTGTSNFYVKLNGSGDVYIKAMSATQNLIFKKLA